MEGFEAKGAANVSHLMYPDAVADVSQLLAELNL